MFDWANDLFGQVGGEISGEHNGTRYRLTLGERGTEVWLLVIAALVVGVLLGSRVRIIR